MSWSCPECGRQNYETFDNCACGYSASGVLLTEYGPRDCENVSEEHTQHYDIALNCSNDASPPLQEPSESHELQSPGKDEPTGGVPQEEVIKEIDSWLFTFSGADSCVAISTPALQSFRLKLSLDDIEDLLEFLYQRTGTEKTMRKLGFEVTDILGVIDKVDRMIEEKKSKVSIKFSGDDLQEIADFINLQLKL